MAFFLKESLKLRASIYLDNLQREGHLLLKCIHKMNGVSLYRMLAYSNDIPSGDGIMCCEAFEDNTRQVAD